MNKNHGDALFFFLLCPSYFVVGLALLMFVSGSWPRAIVLAIISAIFFAARHAAFIASKADEPGRPLFELLVEAWHEVIPTRTGRIFIAVFFLLCFAIEIGGAVDRNSPPPAGVNPPAEKSERFPESWRDGCLELRADNGWVNMGEAEIWLGNTKQSPHAICSHLVPLDTPGALIVYVESYNISGMRGAPPDGTPPPPNPPSKD